MLDNREDVPVPYIDHPWVDRFVPEHLRGTGGIDEVRARILVLSTFSVWLAGPSFGVLHFMQGRTGMAAVCAVAAFLLAPAPIVLQRSGSFGLAANLISIVAWSVIAAFTVITGGPVSPALTWLVLVPTFPYIFDLRRSFRVWLAITVLTPLGVWVADGYGYEFVSIFSHETMKLMWVTSSLSAVLLVSVLFALNSGLQRWLTNKVRRREAENRRVEAELQEARQRALDRNLESLQMVVQRVPDGVVVFRQGRIIQTNPAFRKMLGGEELGALVDVEVAELVAAPERDELSEFIGEIEAGRDVGYREFCLCPQRGPKESVAVEASGFAGVHDQESVGFLVLRDLTERKELQGKLMQMDRMMAVGTLAAGVAHEINNPLAFVHANVEYLLSQTEKYGDDEQGLREALASQEDLVEVLEDIREGSLRIRSIVSDLSTFSTSNDSEKQPLDVEDVLESCIKMGENQIRHRATLVRDYDEIPAVRGVESNLAQVFLNLLVNAAQSIDEGAVENNEVRVSTRLADAGETVIVEVADTGSGIPQEIRPRIFDPFFSTKSQHEGMGLGLAICRNLVRDHGGNIYFESEEGKGTTFTIELPAAPQKAEQSNQFQKPVFARAHKGRALVIDDEEQVGRTIRRMLIDGYDTVMVTSGREALAMLEEDRDFVVIICDLLMPDVSGVDVHATIDEKYPDLIKRMVFITGGTFTEATREFVESCEQPILLKPFDMTEFRQVVDKTFAAAEVAAQTAT